MTIPKKLDNAISERINKAIQDINKTPEQDGTCPALEIARRIISLRNDLGNVRGLVNDMLKLAIDDLTKHRNKSSLFSCVFLKDTKKRTLYVCYNIKDYLTGLGIKLEYDAKKDIKSIFYDPDKWDNVKDNIPSYLSWYDTFKTEQARTRQVLTKYDRVKSLVQELGTDDIQKLLAFIRGASK